MRQEEQHLIKQLKSGHRATLERWYHAYAPRLQRQIAAKIDDPADVQELVQETFIASLQGLPEFGGQSSLLTWMSAIARHKVKDFYRRRYAKKMLQLLPLGEWLLGDLIQQADKSTDELTADLREKVQIVLEAIGGNYRELLLEKYLDELPVAVLARRRGKTFKTVESELYRARQEFKKKFAQLNE